MALQKSTFLFSAFLLVLATSKMAGQNIQVSLSSSFGIIQNNYVEDFRMDEQFKAIGVSLGIESKINKHITFGGDIGLQFLESEPQIAEPFPFSGLTPVVYSIERNQFNFRPTIHYYFKEAYRGLYVGLFGTYSYMTITAPGHPGFSQYSVNYSDDPSDDFGLGGGLTYGYRLKLTRALRVSAFGSHQLFWNDTPKFRQQDHQFGLGLNYAF